MWYGLLKTNGGMKVTKSAKYYISGVIILLLSTPLGYSATNTLGLIKGNLTGEYTTLLGGFILSYLLIGVLIFVLGLVKSVKSE